MNEFGGIGVDIFFAISGFIISYSASKFNGILEGIAFLKKRFLRINPVYYLASMLLLVLFIFTDYQLSWSDIINQFRDMIIMIPVLDSQATMAPFLFVAWTLSLEWYFYLLFFLLILFKVNNKVLLLFLLLPLLIIIRYLFYIQDFRLLFIMNPIMLEFLFGVGIYWLYCHVKVPHWIAGLLIILGITGYALNIFFGYGDICKVPNILFGHTSMQRVLLWGIPSACIVAGCIFYEKNGVLNYLWNNRLIQLMGNASYSIYLIHFPVIYSLTLLYFKIKFYINPDLTVLLLLVISIAVGIIFYRIVEQPLLEYFRTKH